MQDDQLAAHLAQGWQTIYKQSGQAIEWIAKARRSAPRLDNEADHLVLKLRRARNLSASLQRVSQSASTVGFFGLSQAGKSYLISALAAGTNGKLETVLDGQTLDFVDHVNPPGGGKEATGLVTRFTRSTHEQVAGYPLQLRLFSEVELVKIFANSFFNDFNFEKTGFTFEGAQVQQAHEAINAMMSRRQPQVVPGVSQDDVVALWDYLHEHYPKKTASLEGDFLPRLVELAPYLSIRDRASLFSFLWGRIQAFTTLFELLSGHLSALGHPSVVLAPLQALVTPAPSGSGFIQRDSIMNVDMLERLGQADDAPMTVCVGGAAGQLVQVPRAALAALTAELTFALANEPQQAIFNEVDLLDFPGYRGRLKLESFDDLSAATGNAQRTSPVAQLFLRGKVAYLFERYTDRQEMNVLVVCTASHKQSDVADVGPVLSGWIHRTQGETAERRANRPSGLIWAITMFDMKIADSLTKDKAMMDMVWENLIKMTMLERFQQYNWMQEWATDHSFNTTFLVRKPRLPVTFLTAEGEQETGVSAQSSAALDLMSQTFSANPLVEEHVANPSEAWQAMLTLNDGGITRLSHYLAKVAVKEHKLTRLKEQMQELLQDLVDGRLGPWFYHQGADEVQARKQLAQSVVNAFIPRARLLADLQAALLLPDEVLQSLYMRSGLESADEIDAVSVSDQSPGAAASIDLGDDPLGLGAGLDLFGDKPSVKMADGVSGNATNRAAPRVGSDARFARAVLREWINHLRGIPENARLMAYFGFERRVLEQLTDELITGVTRHDLEARLLHKVSQTEQAGTKRERLMERQVLAVKAVLGDFVAWLGLDPGMSEHVVQSRVNPGKPLFAQPARLPSGELPPLDQQAVDHTKIYLGDWLVALATLIVGNAGHDAGREISAEMNAALGDILQALKAVRLEAV